MYGLKASPFREASFSAACLAPEVRDFFQSSVANSAAERDGFALYVSKSVPQRPSSAYAIYGTAEAVPFVDSLPQALKVSEELHVLSKLANLKI
jgi:hypothetical protein